MNSTLDSDRFRAALAAFDAENGRDPNQEVVDGRPVAREWLYAERLTQWVLKLAPAASEALRLAARCQHLRRWEIARDTYPATRAGYLRWRSDLKKFHAEKAAEVLRAVGYDDDLIRSVQTIVRKEDLSGNADCQLMEDALCLLFLEFQAADLAAKADEAKMINALRKSWDKMSPRGRSVALTLPLPPQLVALVKAAGLSS